MLIIQCYYWKKRELKTRGRKKDALQHVEREGYGGPLGCERTPQICLETWTPTQTCPGPPHNGERMATHVQIANCQPRRYDGLWSSGGHENETDGGIIRETSHIPFGGIWSIPMLVTKSKVVKPPDDVLWCLWNNSLKFETDTNWPRNYKFKVDA